MAERETILAVDDMPENLTAIRAILQDYFDLRLARSAKMALTLLENTHVDMILLDIEMPGMSGFQFLEQMYRDHPGNKKIPVIFVTSHANPEFINTAVNAGAKDYIIKPIKPEVLLKKIDTIIGLPQKKPQVTPQEAKFRELQEAAGAGDSARCEAVLKELTALTEFSPENIRQRLLDIKTRIAKFDFEKAIERINEAISFL
ncbi:response regulator receiver modulated metal dependent phosphohydrolase [Treponema primitia ZAS-2]|uniref:Response regulator receiver modulated metal dependent phosphohydrolase n=1 Tax=Treponema primitia (strain ATCC BAA-887 / DSM 12427 / ZAS-2) TaxID=545694 RepID=F5YMP9_TREPZ|nr:response regulator [Treponema primitia]AEF85270.1 response regulator receiver modulated metal dependent phosphohydrolase [Treponema primitia ZAS-2]